MVLILYISFISPFTVKVNGGWAGRIKREYYPNQILIYANISTLSKKQFSILMDTLKFFYWFNFNVLIDMVGMT